MNDASMKSKKPMVWLIVYIVLIVVGQQLAGVGGIIGGAFIAFGLNRAIRNPAYSKGKKILFSVLYAIGGVAIALVIALLLTLVIRYYFPSAGQKSNIESTYQVPTDFSSYKNGNIGISALVYPVGWTIKEADKEEYAVNFQSPNTIANVTASMFLLDEGQMFDYKSYTARLKDEAKSEPRIGFEVMAEEIKNINGKDWLVYNSIITIKSSDNSYYNRTAILSTGKSNKRQYFLLLMESDKEHFAEDSKMFDKIIESARLYE